MLQGAVRSCRRQGAAGKELPPAQAAGKELPPASAGREQGAAAAVAGEDYSRQPQPSVVEPGAPFLATGAWNPTAATWLPRARRAGATK